MTGDEPTAREFALLTPEDLGGEANYRAACVGANLDPIPGGYGLLMAIDGQGRRYTLMTTDVEYVRMVAEASTSPAILAGVELPPDKFLRRDGWPDDWV